MTMPKLYKMKNPVGGGVIEVVAQSEAEAISMVKEILKTAVKNDNAN